MLLEPEAGSVDEQVATPSSERGSVLLTAVEALRQQLQVVHAGADSDADTAARLALAQDELAAIHDEIQQQQEEIAELLSGARFSPGKASQRFLATIPLATVRTDATGKILEASGGVHALLKLRPGSLIGKPIFTVVPPDDRRALRSALSQAGVQDTMLRTTARMRPRNGAPLMCTVALVRDSADAESPGVWWLLLPGDELTDEPCSNRQLEALTRLCRLGAVGEDLRSVLTQAVRLCGQALDHADHVSLVVGDPLEPSTIIASSATAQHLDGLQLLRTAGPQLDAFRSKRPVALRGDVIGADPGFAGDPQAGQLKSVLVVPLIIDARPAGTLTLYSESSTGLATLGALREALPFVEAAQTLIRESRAFEEIRRTQEQLETALTSRAVIDQAKGMIMVTLKCDADQAFAHLVRMSSTRNEKVRDMARRMVDDVVSGRSWPASPSG